MKEHTGRIGGPKIVLAGVLTVVCGTVAHATIFDGLVGHWNFDGHRVDWSVSGNDADAVTGSPGYGAGQLGQALSVGGSDWVRTNNALGITGSQPRTLNVWFNPTALQTEAPASYGANDDTNLFELLLRNDGVYGGHFYGGGNDTLDSGVGTNPTYAAGAWAMGTLTYDGSQVKVYQNGQFKKSLNIALNTGNSALGMGGGGPYTPFDDYDGLVDDVSVWNRALSDPEIQAVYDAAAAGYSLAKPRAYSPSLQFDCSDNNGAAVGYLGPGHTAGAFTGGVWNPIQGNFSGTAKDELGSDVPGITVEFGANDGSGPITNWGSVSLGEWVNTDSGGGVHSTELMTDMIYVSSGSRDQAGVRIQGLPAGQYEVFFMPRHYLVTEPYEIAIGVNIDELAGNSFVSPALAAGLTTWVEGTSSQAGNYFRGLVSVSGPDDWIVMIADQLAGSTINDIMGFQIARVPEPSMFVVAVGLGALGLIGACRRRRRAGA